MARSLTFTYTVTVVDSGGNKYAIDGNTQQYVTLFPPDETTVTVYVNVNDLATD